MPNEGRECPRVRRYSVIGTRKGIFFPWEKMFAQGWIENGICTLVLDQWDPPRKGHVWAHESASWDECWEAFANAPVFDGLTFWEAESEMEWLYG